jgi:hypothetical protein
MVEHLKSPQIHDLPATRSAIGKAFRKDLRFPPNPAPVACYDGTMLRDEIIGNARLLNCG